MRLTEKVRLIKLSQDLEKLGVQTGTEMTEQIGMINKVEEHHVTIIDQQKDIRLLLVGIIGLMLAVVIVSLAVKAHKRIRTNERRRVEQQVAAAMNQQ